MSMRSLMFALLAFVPLATSPLIAATTTRVASGLSRPVFVTSLPQDYDRIFIIEQRTALIKILHFSTGTIDTFLNIDSLVIDSGNERGLLGMCFHPDYANNGYFYVHYDNNAGNSVIARFTVTSNPDSADAHSRFQILQVIQPAGQDNHKSGMISFGPDGYLYVSFGDGGSANDPGNRAQSDTTLLGKMLRIDVDGGSPYVIPPDNPFVNLPPLDEIWAKGLRNPWRWSLDRLTGDLYIADVGQNAWEEVDFQPAGSAGGQNYGWRCMEGFHCTGLTGCTCNSPSLTLPIHEYGHADGCAITGGYVYRGCAIPEYQGLYFFADNCSDSIWSFRYANGTVSELTNRTAELDPPGALNIGDISSFGEDAYGELYICDLLGGEIFKIVPNTMTDCNNNGIPDLCDIASSMSADTNGNGIPDECDCFAVPVANLTVFRNGSDVELRWTANGNGNETYAVYRSPVSGEPFPGSPWAGVASNLPAVLGENEMLYTDPGVVDASTTYFYLVTAECP
jgi:glucose/arabinose dehydrogenase